MPKRPFIDYTFDKPKEPNKKLVAKVINFLINRKIINRRLKFLNPSVRVEAEASITGREIWIKIIQDHHVVESYTINFKGLSKDLILTFTESYTPAYVDWMKKWVDHVVEATSEDQPAPSMPRESDTFQVEEYSG